jgi:hypothetical protein
MKLSWPIFLPFVAHGTGQIWPKRRRPAKRPRARPAVEELEDRTLLIGGTATNWIPIGPSPNSTALTTSPAACRHWPSRLSRSLSRLSLPCWLAPARSRARRLSLRASPSGRNRSLVSTFIAAPAIEESVRREHRTSAAHQVVDGGGDMVKRVLDGDAAAEHVVSEAGSPRQGIYLRDGLSGGVVDRCGDGAQRIGDGHAATGGVVAEGSCPLS